MKYPQIATILRNGRVFMADTLTSLADARDMLAFFAAYDPDARWELRTVGAW